MKSLSIIVAFVAFVAFVKADTATKSPFDKAIDEALESIEAGSKKFQEVTGIKTEFDKAKVQSFLKSGLGDSKKKIDEILKNLETNAKPYSEDFKKNVESLTQKFNEAVKSFNNSETQGNIQKLQENFQTSLKSFVDHAKEVAKSAGVTPSPEIEKNFNELIIEVSKSAKTVHGKLEKVIEDAKKKTA